MNATWGTSYWLWKCSALGLLTKQRWRLANQPLGTPLSDTVVHPQQVQIFYSFQSFVWLQWAQDSWWWSHLLQLGVLIPCDMSWHLGRFHFAVFLSWYLRCFGQCAAWQSIEQYCAILQHVQIFSSFRSFLSSQWWHIPDEGFFLNREFCSFRQWQLDK